MYRLKEPFYMAILSQETRLLCNPASVHATYVRMQKLVDVIGCSRDHTRGQVKKRSIVFSSSVSTDRIET